MPMLPSHLETHGMLSSKLLKEVDYNNSIEVLTSRLSTTCSSVSICGAWPAIASSNMSPSLSGSSVMLPFPLRLDFKSLDLPSPSKTLNLLKFN